MVERLKTESQLRRIGVSQSETGRITIEIIRPAKRFGFLVDLLLVDSSKPLKPSEPQK